MIYVIVFQQHFNIFYFDVITNFEKYFCPLFLQDLVIDPNMHVKSALAGVIMGLAPMLGKDK